MKVNDKFFLGTYNKKMPSLLEFMYWVVKKRTLSGQEIKKGIIMMIILLIL